MCTKDATAQKEGAMRHDHTCPRVLLVDDERDTFDLLKGGMRHYGVTDFAVDYAETPTEAVARLNEQCYDACVLDIRLRGFSGLNLGDLIREHDCNVPLAYLTGLDTEEARAEATQQRAFFWRKDRFTDVHELLKLLGELVRLNPCVGGKRIDNHGYPRKLKETPIEIPPVLQRLVAYSSHKASGASA